jgi:hypothetical protein
MAAPTPPLAVGQALATAIDKIRHLPLPAPQPG